MRQKLKKTSPARRSRNSFQNEQRLDPGLEDQILERDLVASLWERALFYERHQKWQLAQTMVQVILHLVEDPEDEARCFLVMGQLAEQQDQHDEAVQYYAAGLALSPANKNIAYLLHNNTGYCLNRKGEYVQGGRHCQIAVALDPQRHNAWNNLGVSLEGQEDFLGAAWAYLEASKANPSDERSAELMQDLLARRPELKEEISRMLNSFIASAGEERPGDAADSDPVRRVQNG